VKAPAPAKVITIFSTKGGIGKTTIATNLGTALGFDEDNKVCILDLDLQFGDVALFLNVVPKATIADLVKYVDNLDGGVLASYMTAYKDNVKVLAAPSRPEQADGISAAQVASIIKELQYNFDYIIIDTAPLFNDITFGVLDLSDLVMIATSQDLPTLKNVKLCLEILESLNYPAEKIKVLLNRANSLGGLNIKDSEELLRRQFLALLPSDGKTVVTAVNQGVPFVTGSPETAVAQNLLRLANYVISGDEAYITTANKPQARKGIIKKAAQLFSRGGSGSEKKVSLKESSEETLDRSIWSLS
ncbi:Hypothetical protein LUCI_4742, partial [Lucifera butyrica]